MELKNYRVTYSIDIDATSAYNAAKAVQNILLDPDSLPPIFEVVAENGIEHQIELRSHGAELRKRGIKA